MHESTQSFYTVTLPSDCTKHVAVHKNASRLCRLRMLNPAVRYGFKMPCSEDHPKSLGFCTALTSWPSIAQRSTAQADSTTQGRRQNRPGLYEPHLLGWPASPTGKYVMTVQMRDTRTEYGMRCRAAGKAKEKASKNIIRCCFQYTGSRSTCTTPVVL